MEKNFTVEEIERLAENVAVNKCHLSKRIYNKAIATAPYIYIERTEKGLVIEAVSAINSELHHYWEELSKVLGDSNFEIYHVEHGRISKNLRSVLIRVIVR